METVWSGSNAAAGCGGVCRCRGFCQLLWDIFKEPAAPAAAAPDSTAMGAGSRPSSATAAAAAAASTAAEEVEYVLPVTALLLYLCADRDVYAGIAKAVSVVTQRAEPGTTVDAQGVLQLCYPLIQPDQAAPVCRAPLTAQQVAAAVAAAATAGAPSPGTVAAPSAAAAGGKASSGGAASRKPSSPGYAAAPDAQATEAVAPSIKPSQLMYSTACERIVTLSLHRYQWKDVYVAAML